MMLFIRYIKTKVSITLVLLMLVPGYAFCKSDFSVAYQVDDQIITNYDIDQVRKLRNLLNGSSIGRSEVEKIVVSNKIKEIKIYNWDYRSRGIIKSIKPLEKLMTTKKHVFCMLKMIFSTFCQEISQ